MSTADPNQVPPMPQEPGQPTGPDEKQARQWAVVSHLSGLALYVGIPLGNIFGPLIVWLLKKEEFPLVDEHGKEALNYQISWTIWGMLCIPLVCVIVGIPLLIALVIANVVLVIIASVKASNREFFRYPLTIRFLK